MTQDRDDYMLRQEMDHDLLRQRGPLYIQQFGRGLRTPQPPLPPRTFEWDTSATLHLLTDAERRLLAAVLVREGMTQGAADMSLHFMLSILAQVIQRHRLQAYADGERGGGSRSRNSPGNGDMGG